MYFPLTVWIVGLLVLHEPIVKEEDVVLIVAYLKLHGASPNGKHQPVKERPTVLVFCRISYPVILLLATLDAHL